MLFDTHLEIWHYKYTIKNQNDQIFNNKFYDYPQSPHKILRHVIHSHVGSDLHLSLFTTRFSYPLSEEQSNVKIESFQTPSAVTAGQLR